MSEMIEELNLFWWKCFQVLLVGGKNDKKSAKEQGKLFVKFAITDEQFESFCYRYRHLGD
ncbi:radical S-adenosyl methionine domain-containing protein 2 [Coccidioides immitis RMSCC 2394]|uniref:Radical S-adenosyl methionine domain-containing protein 2 n=1 Tax=Coccidioides immitis RMSCC 2394 TaxID=404692 RepID=A0A0J6YC63_COCIT|nr:radical S-adenosyl methionine domain-containing protein 2 [Coccidioides immitis RMSCC 2394]